MHHPAHPGTVLREYLPENMSVTEAAARLGVTRQAFSSLLNGRSGVSAEMWLSMQVTYDLWEAEQKPRPRVKRFAA